MLRIVVVAVIVACASGGKQLPAERPPAAVQASQSGPPGESVDGREVVVYGVESQWCSWNTSSEVRGFCYLDRAKCESERLESAKTDFTWLVEKQGGFNGTSQEQRKGIAMAAIEAWVACALTDAMACLRARHVLSGSAVTVCYPTIGACDRGIDELRYSSDVKSSDARCAIYRVRK